MIYQCYFADSQLASLFQSPLYQGFGLEPEVNANLLTKCPELEFPAIRLQLVEYAAMLNLWRNPPNDSHDWIGFSSWRQLDKTPFMLTEDFEINRMLENLDILGWGYISVLFQECDLKPVCAIASENSHPGIIAYLRRMMSEYNQEIPASFWQRESDFFSNYWIMSKENFHAFMVWSWPLIEWGIKHLDDYQFTRTNERGLGFIAERLFIFWRHLYGKQAQNIGKEIILNVAHSGMPLNSLMAQLKTANMRIKELEAIIKAQTQVLE